MYWKKESGSEEFIEICDYLADKRNDYYTYSHYPSPLYHIKYPVLNKGWKTQLKEMIEETKQTIKQSWSEETEEEQANRYEYILIQKLNRWASSNITWKDGKDGRKRFAEAKDMIYYFKKEASFQ